MDSVILADDYAQSIAGNTNSTAYKQALWEKTQDFTIHLFANASHTLAEMIYNAWLLAGSPSMTASAGDIAENDLLPSLHPNIPNPFKSSTTIHYSLVDNANVQLFVRNSEGMMVDTLVDGFMSAGEYTYEWKPGNLAGGVYYLVFHAGAYTEVRKMLLVDR